MEFKKHLNNIWKILNTYFKTKSISVDDKYPLKTKSESLINHTYYRACNDYNITTLCKYV